MVISNRVPFHIAISQNARVAQRVANLGFARRPSRPKRKVAIWRGEDGT